MAKKCDVCGRGPASANNVSHAKNITKRKQYLNLQTKTINNKKTKII